MEARIMRQVASHVLHAFAPCDKRALQTFSAKASKWAWCSLIWKLLINVFDQIIL